MDAVLVRQLKERLSGGYIVEIIVWHVPSPVPGSSHLYEYRMFFGRSGERIIGYDNERGKGDHVHRDGTEVAYAFKDIETTQASFLNEVEEWRKQHREP